MMQNENSVFHEAGMPSHTILLVDDSPVNLGVVVENLESHGYDVVVALDGEEALQRVDIALPDLILLDVMMPGMDGFEVCRRLKAQYHTRDIPVIFMTSLGGLADKVRGFAAGGVDYITKPLQAEEARARVGTHLEMRELRRRLETKNSRLEREIAERKRAEDALSAILGNTPDTVARYDRECRRVYANPALAAQVEDGAAFLLGKTPSECDAGPNSDVYESKLKEVLASGQHAEFELVWTNREGREIAHHIRLTAERDAAGNVVSVLGVGRDITELNAHRKRIYQMAFYDPLTSLPNRALFNDRLGQMLTDAAWHQQQLGVMLLDLDRFKVVNDTLGHAAGDELLCEAAARLAYCLRGYDTVARLGGDEYAILLPEVRSSDDLGRIANKILVSFNDPFLLDDKEVFISCSLGIAMYPSDASGGEDLLKQADSAMYLAKRSGRNTFRFYSTDLMDSANERLELESDLRRGFARGELELHYQPKVSFVDGLMVGSEALLRWKHPQRGMVAPDKFIPIAEDCGLIVEIGEWVLRDACRTAREWNVPGKPLHKVAINLSARQFQTGNLLRTVCKVFAETGCKPEWVELEITESLLLDEDGDLLEVLSAFREMGITIAIDDFGTGYSALSYLARFPIDTLKIDRSFTSRVTDSGHHAELVRAILSIARSLNQEVVAEGVETSEQAEFLRKHGCHVAQGYLYSKPLPKAVFEQLPIAFGRSEALE